MTQKAAIIIARDKTNFFIVRYFIVFYYKLQNGCKNTTLFCNIVFLFNIFKTKTS